MRVCFVVLVFRKTCVRHIESHRHRLLQLLELLEQLELNTTFGQGVHAAKLVQNIRLHDA